MHYEKGAGELGDVENEDYVSALLRLADGLLGGTACGVEACGRYEEPDGAR